MDALHSDSGILAPEIGVASHPIFVAVSGLASATFRRFEGIEK